MIDEFVNHHFLGCFGVAVPAALPCISTHCRHSSRITFWPHVTSGDFSAPCSTDAETGDANALMRTREPCRYSAQA